MNKKIKSIIINLNKNKLINGINIFSLASGLSIVTLILLILNHQLGYDKFHKYSDRIYIIEESVGSDRPYYVTVPAILPKILSEFPEVEHGTRIIYDKPSWIKAGTTELNESVAYVDNDFFKIFSFPFLMGEQNNALKKLNSIVISKELSERLFSNKNPIGLSLKVKDKFFVIDGVMDKIPENSTNRPSLIANIENYNRENIGSLDNWNQSFCPTYILINKNFNDEDRIRILSNNISSLMKKYSNSIGNKKLKLLKFEDLFSTSAGQMYKVLMYGLTFIGLFVSCIVLLNFFNLSLLTIFSRLQNMAIKKSIGSSSLAISIDIFWENVFYMVLSTFLGIVSLYLYLPIFNNYFGTKFEFDKINFINIILVFVFFIIVTSSLVALYPTKVLSGNNITRLLRGNIVKINGLQRVRAFVVTIQFVVAISLCSCTYIVINQLNFLKGNDKGFNDKNIVIGNLNLDFDNNLIAYAKINRIINELNNNVGAIKVTASSFIPGRFFNNFITSETQDNKEFLIRSASVDNEYFNVFQIPIIKGRGFSKQVSSDSINSVVINEKLVKILNRGDVLGKNIFFKGSTSPFTIIGISKDYHFMGLNKEVEPLVHFCTGSPSMRENSVLSVKTIPGYENKIRDQIYKSFDLVISKNKLSLESMEDHFKNQYYIIDKTSNFLFIVAIITIIIACTGIIGLSFYIIQQKIREICMRKILGADNISIITNLIKPLLLVILLSSIIAAPITYLLMSNWLKPFAMHVVYPWWVTFVAGLFMIFISFVAVISQAYKASVVNPSVIIKK